MKISALADETHPSHACMTIPAAGLVSSWMDTDGEGASAN